MTVSTMDTAKLPHTGVDESVPPTEAVHGTVASGVTDPGADAMRAALAQPVPPPSGDRTANRRARRQLRRQQRLYAAAGIAVLAAVFLVAVVVLGGIR